jgi:hypothetical protein
VSPGEAIYVFDWMCVFGHSLLEAFTSDPPELFTKRVRAGGVSSNPRLQPAAPGAIMRPPRG